MRLGSASTAIIAVAVATGAFVVGRVSKPGESLEEIQPLLSGEVCYCDAAQIDSSQPIDGSIDPNQPWAMHIAYGYATAGASAYTGADGVDLTTINGLLADTTAFEEAARVGAFLRPACGAPSKDPWTPILFTQTVGGAEDAIFKDIDLDGYMDIAAAGSGDFKIRLWFGPTNPADTTTPSAWTSIIINASNIGSRWMRVAATDFDHDGKIDVAACGYAAGARFGYFTSATPRDPASWTFHDIGQVGACQEMAVRDVNGDGWEDIDISDRDTIFVTFTGLADDDTLNKTNHGFQTGNPINVTGGALPGGLFAGVNYWTIRINTNAYKAASSLANAQAGIAIDLTSNGSGTAVRYDLRGSRAMINPAGTGGLWALRTMQGAPPVSTRWTWFSPVDGWTAIHGTATGGSPNVNTLRMLNSTDGAIWTSTDLPVPTNIGWYQASTLADLNGDGLLDYAVTSSTADGDLEGVVWMKNTGAAYTQGKVSGAAGCKFDNIRAFDIDCDGDLDLITSEQGCSGGGTPVSERLGVVWYENPLIQIP